MGDTPLRIVSYNVRYFGHALRGLASTVGPKRRVALAISALDPLPDVVLLQEVETSSFRSSVGDRPSHPGETQLQAFMGRMEEIFGAQGREMPYDAFYFRAHHYKVWDFSLYTTGLAILVNRKTLRFSTKGSGVPVGATAPTKDARLGNSERSATIGGCRNSCTRSGL